MARGSHQPPREQRVRRRLSESRKNFVHAKAGVIDLLIDFELHKSRKAKLHRNCQFGSRPLIGENRGLCRITSIIERARPENRFKERIGQNPLACERVVISSVQSEDAEQICALPAHSSVDPRVAHVGRTIFRQGAPETPPATIVRRPVFGYFFFLTLRSRPSIEAIMRCAGILIAPRRSRDDAWVRCLSRSDA